MDEDTTKRRRIIALPNNVDALYGAATTEVFECILDIAPGDVIQSAGNADARFSNEGHRCIVVGEYNDYIEGESVSIFFSLYIQEKIFV